MVERKGAKRRQRPFPWKSVSRPSTEVLPAAASLEKVCTDLFTQEGAEPQVCRHERTFSSRLVSKTEVACSEAK